MYLHAMTNTWRKRSNKHTLGDLRQKTYQASVILSKAKDLLFKQKQILRYRSE